MRTFLYTAIFFLITPITLVLSFFALDLTTTNSRFATSTPHTRLKTEAYIPPNIYAPASSLTLQSGLVGTEIIPADARVEIIRQYLKKYNSPLLGEEKTLVRAADKYGLDFRLLVAIAQQESNLCKVMPKDSYNCWGWGIHSRGTLRFHSYKEAIEAVAKGLREEYIDKGYTTPELIMKKYTPLSKGTWAAGVREFMVEME